MQSKYINSSKFQWWLIWLKSQGRLNKIGLTQWLLSTFEVVKQTFVEQSHKINLLWNRLNSALVNKPIATGFVHHRATCVHEGKLSKQYSIQMINTGQHDLSPVTTFTIFRRGSSRISAEQVKRIDQPHSKSVTYQSEHQQQHPSLSMNYKAKVNIAALDSLITGYDKWQTQVLPAEFRGITGAAVAQWPWLVFVIRETCTDLSRLFQLVSISAAVKEALLKPGSAPSGSSHSCYRPVWCCCCSMNTSRLGPGAPSRASTVN